MTDPITDMLNRIRNAQAVLKPTVMVPFSQMKYEIAKVLAKQGFIKDVEKKTRKAKKFFEITLQYKNISDLLQKKRTRPKIQGLKRISKPGQRIYINYKAVKPVRAGFGMAIISTSKGIMTDREAKKQKLGGEVLCEIW